MTAFRQKRAVCPPSPISAPVSDQAERERIIRELRRCLLVEAGAGGGKTERLIARLIELLASGECTVDTLAAITFTRKAAAELRARFQVALEGAAQEASGERRLRLTAALAHIEQVFIGTIHSFCARLLRERPVEAGVDIAFTEIDDAEDARLRRQAWDTYVAGLHLGEDPVLSDLGSHGLEVQQLANAFIRFADYADVQEWPVPPVSLPDLAPVLADLQAYTCHMGMLAQALPLSPSNDRLLANYRLIPRLVRQADLFQPASVLEVLEHFIELAPREVRFQSWPEGGVQARAELARWNEFSQRHAVPCCTAWRAVRYGLVLRVLQNARVIYDRLRDALGCLSYQDLLLRAAALLRDRPEVRGYFRARFTHLLIDEFQDTDPVQAEVTLLLTADDTTQTDWRRCRPVPGALFIVADPKQSIYRFRRADIATYNQVRQIVLDGGGAVVELSSNFRTQGTLVDWVNEVFADVFPAVATPQMPARRLMTAGRVDASSGKLAGIHLLRLPHCGDKRALAEHEAECLARTIRHVLDAGLTVPRTARELQLGITPPAQPGDFLIITRTTRQLGIYARKLQEYHIPFQMTGGAAWEDVPELAWLAMCLRAVTRPDDAIALLAILRSELFGLSDPDLYALARAGGRFSYRMPLPAELDPAVLALYADAFGRLRRYDRWLQCFPPVAAVEKIVADLGLAARAAAGVGGNGRAGTLAKAIELIRDTTAELSSVSDVLGCLDRLMESQERFNGVPARPHEGSVVRLMNLHQVKGLEAPVVFLADPSGAWEHPIDLHIDRSSELIRGYLAVLDPDGGYHPKILACPSGWEDLAEAERTFRRAEEQRLLYVAATRCGSQLTVSQRSRYPQYNPWRFFEPHLAACPELPDPALISPKTGPVTILTEGNVAAASEAIAARWHAARRPSYAKAGVRELALETPVMAGAGQKHGVEWGTVLHRLLHVAVLLPGADLSHLAVSALQDVGLDVAMAGPAVAVIRSVMGSALWQRAQAASQRLAEVPFQVCRNSDPSETDLPMILSGVIDLVFRELDGWVLVDYKSDTVEAPKLAELIEHYRPQVALYAEMWRQMTGEPVKETGLYFTHLGRYVEVNGR